MVYTSKDVMEELGYINKYEYMVMRYLSIQNIQYKTRIMQDLIKQFPDDIDAGEYLIPGKPYSDDIDQAVNTLKIDGVICECPGGLTLTEWGQAILDALEEHPEAEIDENLAEFMELLDSVEDDSE